MTCKKIKPEIIKVCGENLRKLEVVLDRYSEIIYEDDGDQWDAYADKLLKKIQRKLGKKIIIISKKEK